MYIERAMQSTLHRYLKQFKVVLVTGPRQSGKTTMLKHCLGNTYDYITLDDMNTLYIANDDPKAFLNKDTVPVVIDEVQLAPDIFRQTKLVVDALDEYGSVVLTGSQTYHLMQGVSESLAGRVGIIELSTLSLRELLKSSKTMPYVPVKVKQNDVPQLGTLDIWDVIQRGSMPRLQDGNVEWDAYYSAYVKTYLERDVRQLIRVRDESRFYRFMVACAARTGQLLNASDIANTIDVDVKTVKDWISVLEASGLIYIMQPFWTNTNKRLAKTPKLFFMDTGLACYLTSWNTPDQLKNGAMAGHMFETFVIGEVLKSYMNAGRDTRSLSFYRDARKREIDLVVQDGHTLHPVEIKAGMQVRSEAIKNFKCLEDFADFEVGFGNVICQTKEPYLLNGNVQAIPVWAI